MGFTVEYVSQLSLHAQLWCVTVTKRDNTNMMGSNTIPVCYYAKCHVTRFKPLVLAYFSSSYDNTLHHCSTYSRNRAPPPRPDIKRETTMRVLGVIVNDKLTAVDHVTTLLSSSSRMLYAMRVLRAHGTPATSLYDIFHATVISRIEYAAPAWSGMCSATDSARLDSLLLRRSKRLGYCNDDLPAVADLFSTSDDEFFRRVTSNSTHVLHLYLPDETHIPYQLRTRSHRMTLINKTKFLNHTDFIIRLLYKHSY